MEACSRSTPTPHSTSLASIELNSWAAVILSPRVLEGFWHDKKHIQPAASLRFVCAYVHVACLLRPTDESGVLPAVPCRVRAFSPCRIPPRSTCCRRTFDLIGRCLACTQIRLWERQHCRVPSLRPHHSSNASETALGNAGLWEDSVSLAYRLENGEFHIGVKSQGGCVRGGGGKVGTQ